MSSWQKRRASIVQRLTRRRAWALIALLVTWNGVISAVLLHQALQDQRFAGVIVAQTAVVAVLVIVISVWLLRQTRSSSAGPRSGGTV